MAHEKTSAPSADEIAPGEADDGRPGQGGRGL